MYAHAHDAHWCDEMPLASHAKIVAEEGTSSTSHHALEEPVTLLLWVLPQNWVKDIADMWMPHKQQQLALFVYKFAMHVDFSFAVMIL